MDKKNILLTGSTGFIGSNFTARYSNRIRRCAVRNSQNTDSSYLYVADLESQSEWHGAFDGVECIIHLAGLAHSPTADASQYQSINVRGTVALARKASEAGVRRFVFVSTVLVSGTASESPIDEDSEPDPSGAYAESKLQAESELLQLARECSMDVVIVRPVLVYGSNAPANFGALVRLIARVPLLALGSIQNRRSLISVMNLVDFLVLCADHPKARNEIFVVSDEGDLSICQLAKYIARGLGKRRYVFPFPILALKLVLTIVGKKNVFESLTGDFWVDTRKARNLLDWQPSECTEVAIKNLSLEE